MDSVEALNHLADSLNCMRVYWQNEPGGSITYTRSGIIASFGVLEFRDDEGEVHQFKISLIPERPTKIRPESIDTAQQEW